MKMKSSINLLVILAGCSLSMACQRDVIPSDRPAAMGGNSAVIGLIPESEARAKSFMAAEGRSFTADALDGKGSILITENISGITPEATKGVPATTENFADLYASGIRAFSVYAGSTDRSQDLATTFLKDKGSSYWSHYYEDETWPEDNKLLYYFTVPSSIPAYVSIDSTSYASQESRTVVFSLKEGYPTSAKAQKDLMFAANDIDVVRGGVSQGNLIKFYHVFTAVRFKQADSGGKYTITGVTLTGMPVSGTCTVTPSEDKSSSSCSVWTHPEAVRAYGDFTQELDGAEAMFCIPQTFSGERKVTLKVHYSVAGGGTGSDEFDFGKAMDGRSWLAGQMYTYSITVSDLGVDVSCSSAGSVWNDPVITNTGNVSGYIRAAMASAWVKDTPDGDESIILGPCDIYSEGTFTSLGGGHWAKSGDYFYYTRPVKSGQATGERLFSSYSAGTPPFADAYLQFVVMAQIVPYDGNKDAARKAWGEAAASLLETF